ncbi:hypothetical protein ACFUMH_18835 [Cellulomonas sp. NPDC057328]|uniref:hypothetical protein n=1 Tax=Cellulomonas sp. NPDC057328 TaxID=3346101 RepID=UPI00363B3E76
MTSDRATGRVARLAGLLRIAGVLGAVGGVAYAVNGITQARALVKVPVTLAQPEQGSGAGNVRVAVDGLVAGGDGWFAGAEPGLLTAGVPDGTLTLAAWDSTRLEQALGRGDWLVGGLALLVVALLLGPVLTAVADRRPFAPGTARRLAVAGVTVAVAGQLAGALPHAAGLLVLERTGLAGPAFSSLPALALWPIATGLLLVVLAVAWAQGERLAADVDGLV